MCLTIPKKVLSVKNGSITVNSEKGRQSVGALIKVKKGDWVLTQNNFIIDKITSKQALEIKKLFSKQK